MKHKILITTLTALGLLLSGAGHADEVYFQPNGTQVQGQVVGNKLMLHDATGMLTPARDGIYKTGNGKAVVVQGGIIATQGTDKLLPAVQKPSASAQRMDSPAATRGGMAMKDKKAKGPDTNECSPITNGPK